MKLSCIFAIVAIALTSCRASKEYIQSTTTTTKRDTILIEKSTYIKDSTVNQNDTVHHFRDRYIVNNIYKNIYRDSIRTDTITKTPPTKKCDKKTRWLHGFNPNFWNRGFDWLCIWRKAFKLRGLAALPSSILWKFGCGTTVPHFSKLGEGLE